MKEMDDMMLSAPCGEYCELCPQHIGGGQHCVGCNFHRGHPAWGDCRLYACVSKHSIEHCGLCADFPCDFFIGHFDPNNPEGQRNAIVRTGLLAYRRKHGDKKWLDLAKRMGSWKKIRKLD